MKSTGITRPVDELGRIVVPKELRRTLGIETRDRLEIFTDGDAIVMRKFTRGCVLCGEASNVVDCGGKPICASCARKIATIVAGGHKG